MHPVALGVAVTTGIAPEIGKLVRLAQSGSSESRSELYLSIAGLMQARRGNFGDSERQLLHAIMAQLTRQVEMQVRGALAERLAEAVDAPQDLILLLANDRIEVAQAILEKSTLLSEDELLDIINATSQLHQRAIAGRPDVTPRIAASLAESSAIEVLVALVRNQRARIAQETMERLAERSRASTELQRGVLARPEMAEDLAKRMCAYVSEALQSFITERFRIDPAAVRRDIALASAEAHARLTQASGPERLVAKLHAAGQLKPGFAVKALGQGQLDVFEHATAKLIGMQTEPLGRLLKAGNAQTLAMVCQAVGIDRSAFATLFSQAEQLRGRSGILSQQDRAQADEVFQRLTRDDARQNLMRKAA
jgi:uncharacterized protein (DUF2336 family)